MRKFVLLNVFIFIFIFGACNCGSQKNAVMNNTYDFSSNIIHHNMQYASNDFSVDEEDKRIIEKALCRIEIILFYESIKFKGKMLVRGIEGSGFFPFETEDELFFLTAGHITVGISEIPKVIIAPLSNEDPKETIFILAKIEYRIWNTHNEKDVIIFSSKEVKVVAEEFSKGIDFGILSFEKRDGLKLHATPIRWGTTKNLESGDMVYLFAEPSYMGKFLTKGYVINPGSLNSDVAPRLSIKPENIFYMSNDLTHGSSGGPVFAIGKEDGKLYLVGIAVMFNPHPAMILKIATKIDHVIEALRKYE